MMPHFCPGSRLTENDNRWKSFRFIPKLSLSYTFSVWDMRDSKPTSTCCRGGPSGEQLLPLFGPAVHGHSSQVFKKWMGNGFVQSTVRWLVIFHPFLCSSHSASVCYRAGSYVFDKDPHPLKGSLILVKFS